MGKNFYGELKLKRESLAIFLFHPSFEYQGAVFTKPHHSLFIEELADHFEKIYLIAPYFKTDSPPAYDYRFSKNNIEIVKGFFSKWSYPLRFFQQLYFSVRAGQVLFFAPSVGSIFVAPLLKLFRIPFYFYFASDPMVHFSTRKISPQLSRLLGKAQIKIAAWSKGVLATGTHNVRYVRDKVQVIRVSPLLDFRNSGHSKIQEIKRTPFRVLYVGLINRAKRVHILVEAIHLLKQQGHLFQADIVGKCSESVHPSAREQEYYDSVKQKVDELGLSSEVNFTGYISNPERLSELYASSQFLVLVSESEGFPKVVYEAMRGGAVPVLTYLESYEGFLKAGENCIFVEPTAGELKKALLSSSEVIGTIRSCNYEFVKNIIATSPAKQFLSLLNNPIQVK